MIDLSDLVDEFVFYDSLSGLYFSVDNAVERMCWVKDWKSNYACFFATGHGDLVSELYNLINYKETLELNYRIIGLYNNFKSIGFGNIWIIPVVCREVGGYDIQFGDCLSLINGRFQMM